MELSPLPAQEQDVEIGAKDEVRRARRQGRALKELDGLLQDNACKVERDKNLAKTSKICGQERRHRE